jgi:uncharacterized membrane protein YqjE
MIMQQDAQQHRVDSAPDEDVLSHVVGWCSAVRTRFHLVAELAVAEVRFVALGAAAMCFLGIAAALLLFGAWALAIAASIIALMQHGVSLWVALAGFAIVHALAGVFMMLRAVSISKNLTFAATRQQLSGIRASET